ETEVRVPALHLNADPAGADRAAVVERPIEVLPHLDDRRVGPAPAVDEALEVRVDALGTHSAERADAAVVAEGEDGDLAFVTPRVGGLRVEVEHTPRGLDVDVPPRLEGVEHPLLPGEPRDDARLDRGVVRDDEGTGEERADESLQGVRARAAAGLDGLDRGLGLLDRVELRAGEVVELDAATGPSAGVRAEEAERAPEPVVL